MNLKKRIEALETQSKINECPPFQSMYWSHDEQVAWELANNPHLDAEKTVAERQAYLDSYYN